MIGHFPEPYPDELLASICARFAKRLNLQAHKPVIEELFGRNALVVFDLPSRLARLADQLPKGHPLTAKEMLNCHTLFPLYSPFFPSNRRKKIAEGMIGNGGKAVHMMAGIMASRIRRPRWLRLCPQCFEEEVRVTGEPYWHRIHQIPGLEYCAEHECRLLDTATAYGCRFNRHHLETPARAQRIVSSPAEPETAPQFVTLARDARWLLQTNPRGPGVQRIHRAYLRALDSRGLTTKSGRLYLQELKHAFVTYHGLPLLTRLQSSFEEDDSAPWLATLLREPARVQAPIRHLLLMRFLGYSAQEFLALATETEGNCLDATKAATQPSDSRQHRKEKTVDGLRLKQLWHDRNASLRKIARELGLDPITVKRKAVKAGLSFPRRGIRISRAPTSNKRRSLEDERRRYRRRWGRLRDAHPTQSTQQLRSKQPALYAWLYRNDKTWLAENRPARLEPRAPRTHVRWDERDKHYAREVGRAAAMIKSHNGRITKSGLAQRLGIAGRVRRQSKKLPLTTKAINAVTESRVTHARFRLLIRAQQLQQTGKRIAEWRLLRSAGIRPELAELPEIKQILANTASQVRSQSEQSRRRVVSSQC